MVSPGAEEEGFFNMPCGQSGNPLSAHYRDANAAWERDDPSPFLPGPPVETLRLVPAASRHP
jgi:penicillin amidase